MNANYHDFVPNYFSLEVLITFIALVAAAIIIGYRSVRVRARSTRKNVWRSIMEETDSLMKYADMSAELARRIEKHKNDYIDISQFTELIKTRNLTYTRISRALLHVLLSIKKDSMKEYAEYGYTGYARVLGFKKGASELIRFMNEKANVPVITRCAEYKGKLKHPFKEMYEEDLKASLIRDLIVKEIYDTDLTGDLARITVTKDDMILG